MVRNRQLPRRLWRMRKPARRPLLRLTTLARVLLVLPTISLTSGCAAGNADPKCAGFQPFPVVKGQWETLPRWVKVWAVAYNEAGETNCGWVP